MIDQQLDNSPSIKGKISRRDFLKLSGGVIGGWLIGSVAGRWIAETYGNEIAEQIGQIKLSEEAKKMIPGIVRFRESLGLEGLPAEIGQCFFKKESWTSKSENFTNALPEKNRSYGLRINEIMIILFGQNGQRLVKGAKTDYKYPYGMCFDPNDRQCNVSDTVHCIPIEDKFTDYVLHEAAGHGSDPSLNLIMPPELLIKVEYGKWMALSECLSVEGQFLNHPHDLMFPLLKRSIGETVGKSMVVNRGIDDIVDERSIASVTQIIAKVAERRRKYIGDLKFNKSVCREIGGALVSLLRNGQIKFRGELKKEYQNSMEIACVEIYAEMVKYALLYSDLIGRNQNILNGVKQVFSAFQDKPVADIDDSRIKIQSPSKNVLDRYVAEKAFLTQIITAPALSPTLTAEQQERVKKEQEEFERKEKKRRLKTLLIKEKSLGIYRYLQDKEKQ